MKKFANYISSIHRHTSGIDLMEQFRTTDIGDKDRFQAEIHFKNGLREFELLLDILEKVKPLP